MPTADVLKHLEKNMTQKKRYYELDLARAVPMLFMPLVHVYEEFLMHGFATGESWSQGLILVYLCMFGPSVFMLSLGMNLVFSSHNTPKDLAQRGIRTIALFYGLNVIRYIIPGSIAILCGDAEAKYSILRHFFCSDILFFAGITFLLFSVIQKYSIKPFYVLLMAVTMLVVDMLIPDLNLNSEILSIALGKFFYVNGWSCFPVLSWMVYPAVGYCLGPMIQALNTEKEHRTFWKKVILGSVVGFLAVGICMSSYGLDPILIAASPANSYIVDTANVVLDLFVAGLMYGFYYYVHLLIRNTRLVQHISSLSRGILTFYCIHWILVGWTEYMLLAMGMRNQHILGIETIMGIGVGIMVISIILTIAIQKLFASKG